jgi:Na+(H+)/acetate symporter ActP
VVELVLAAGRQGKRSTFGMVAGGVAGLVVAAVAPFQNAWVHSRELPGATPVIATAVVGAIFGVLGGFLGSRFGGMLRQLAPAEVQEGR